MGRDEIYFNTSGCGVAVYENYGPSSSIIVKGF
jgi:hypothetical protein